MNTKTLLKALCGLCLMAMCWAPVQAQSGKARGDVDRDGVVTISDVTSLIDYLLSNEDLGTGMSVADTDRDGSVNITDVTVLIDYLLTGEWPYVPEPVTFTVSGVSFTLVPVQGGTFMMGGADDDEYARPWEKPVHEVTLSDYYIGETEVTQELWKAVMGSNPSYFRSYNGYTDDTKRPVENITYAKVKDFITKLNQKTGKVFRLPTEAEWEYAARGGNKSNGYLYAGSNNIDEVAWYKGNADGKTHRVGSKNPNELGLYDMSGNIEEWVNDFYDLYTEEPQTNPQGPATGNFRVGRGGNWDSNFRSCRATYRYDALVTASSHYGFRIAMDPEQ